ncbi:hypothetical protein LG329_00965 [Virgibacillus necropolis]|uniref:hypothetical protein n=1 Tax=Virgibacillus necropolis TaxID=163877 RepID=UPI003850E7D9
MKKFMTLIALTLIFMLALPTLSLASEKETSQRTEVVKEIVLPEMNLEMTSDDQIPLLSDAPGWQHIATDIWYVDNLTTTEPQSVSGGGVMVCFYDQAYSYGIELWEHDNLSKNDFVDKTTIGSGDVCVPWSGVNTEAGNEELYLKFTKSSTVVDKIQVEWHD